MVKFKKPAISKRILIDNANQTIVIVTAIAAFLSVFSLVASKALFSQLSYQGRIISAKQAAKKTLDDDLNAASQLKTSFLAFNSQPQNIIGGNPFAVAPNIGPSDGSNANIILDALPQTYDFPALATSLQNIIQSQGLTIKAIQGTDDELTQQSNVAAGSPKSVPIPFSIAVEGTYTQVGNLINAFNHSIRPFQIKTISIDASGGQNDLVYTATAQTFYQPAVKFTIGQKVIK